MTWNELQAAAEENKWGIAGLCFQKSECVSWDEDAEKAKIVIRAPIRMFCEPFFVTKIRDRLTEVLQKPVFVSVIAQVHP